MHSVQSVQPTWFAHLVVRHRSEEVALVRVHRVEHHMPQRLRVVLLRTHVPRESAFGVRRALTAVRLRAFTMVFR